MNENISNVRNSVLVAALLAGSVPGVVFAQSATMQLQGEATTETRTSPAGSEGSATITTEAEAEASATPEWTDHNESDPGVAAESDAAITTEAQTTKESKEKAGTEDISIGVGEPQEAQHNESNLEFLKERASAAELVAELSSEPVKSRAVFIKFDDIKGESDDKKSSAKKPKEIVVVGSKVRGWDPKKKEAIEAYTSGSGSVHTYDDLVLSLAAKALADDAIKDIEVRDGTSVSLTHRTTLHVLGFIPVQTNARVDADAAGRVKVKFPWFAFFSKKSSVDPYTELATEIRTDLNRIAIEEEGIPAVDESKAKTR